MFERSFEEFAIRKARGASLKLDANLFNRPFSKFFHWNGLETPENHYPVDPMLLGKVKRKIAELETLEGVRAVAAKINLNFSRFVKRVDRNGELRKIYEDSKAAPEEL